MGDRRRFLQRPPAWERVGVEMVESVNPYEEAKIRI
jgi:mannitol-1-phosphate/altronate dehydrogenase